MSSPLTSEEFVKFPETIDEAVNKAAQFLPEDYIISINVELHGYGVELQKPNYSIINTIDGGEGICSDINEAIIIALKDKNKLQI